MAGMKREEIIELLDRLERVVDELLQKVQGHGSDNSASQLRVLEETIKKFTSMNMPIPPTMLEYRTELEKTSDAGALALIHTRLHTLSARTKPLMASPQGQAGGIQIPQFMELIEMVPVLQTFQLT